jgi:adenylosuccinate synthase
MVKGRIIPVVGGQFGSEGKGAVVTWLTREACDAIDSEASGTPYPLVVRIGGPNAGHTGYGRDLRKWVTRTLPIATIDKRCGVAIAQSSEIDTTVLHEELDAMKEFDAEGRIWIDPQATLLDETHKTWERSHQLHERLGSTAKGIGAARAARIMRSATLWEDAAAASRLESRLVKVSELCRDHLDKGGDVFIETSQGYGLGLHAGFYPFCTSADCTAADAVAAVGLPAQVYDVHPWVVLRTFPIRVAGTSGPLKDETSWAALSEISNGHIKPEMTTVTKKIRRVGGWDQGLAVEACRANGAPDCSVALTFLDYLYPGSYEEDTAQKLAAATLYRIRAMGSLTADAIGIGARIRLVTTGPATAIRIPDSLYEREPVVVAREVAE